MRQDASTQSGYDTAVVAATLAAVLARATRAARCGAVAAGSVRPAGQRQEHVRAAAVGAARERARRRTEIAFARRFLLRPPRTRAAGARRCIRCWRRAACRARTISPCSTAHARCSARSASRAPSGARAALRQGPRHAPAALALAPRDAPPDLIVLEGWCVGVPPQPAGALARPLNALEREEDARRPWRSWVNTQLAGAYAPLVAAARRAGAAAGAGFRRGDALARASRNARCARATHRRRWTPRRCSAF